jgi:hypothetical protein
LLQPQLLSRFVFLHAQTRWPSDTAASVAADLAVVVVAVFAVVAAPSVEPGLTVEGFAVALTAVAFVAIGSTIAISTTGLSFLAILGTRSFTIPIRITDTILMDITPTVTIPTDIILTVTDTVVLAAALVAVAFVAVALVAVAFAAVAFVAVAFVAVAFAAVGDPYINLFSKAVPDTTTSWLSKFSSVWLVQTIIIVRSLA